MCPAVYLSPCGCFHRIPRHRPWQGVWGVMAWPQGSLETQPPGAFPGRVTHTSLHQQFLFPPCSLPCAVLKSPRGREAGWLCFGGSGVRSAGAPEHLLGGPDWG